MTRQDFIKFVRPGQALVLRACPGSGKTTLLHELAGQKTFPVISHSADDFRVVNGAYVFDASKNGDCHGACLRAFIDSARTFSQGNAVLACDNTNVGTDEAAPYVAVAAAYGWEPVIVEIEVDPDTCLSRQVHAVPEARVRAMAERIRKSKLPQRWTVLRISDNV